MLGHRTAQYLLVALGVVFLLGFPRLAMGQPSYEGAGDSAYEHRNIYGERVDLSLWRPELLERCYFQGRVNSANDAVGHIKDLIRELDKDPTLGSYLLDIAESYNTAFCMDETPDGNYSYFDLRQNVILIKSFLSGNEQLIFFVHELRHLDTATRGFCPSLEYDIQEMSRLTLASEADAQAVSTLFAWRLRPQTPEVWDSLLGLEHYGDIAHAFEQEAVRSGDELSATRAAFVQWYANNQRTLSYHLQACMAYLDKVGTNHSLRSYERLPEGFFDGLCLLPDGTNYGCHLSGMLKRSE